MSEQQDKQLQRALNELTDQQQPARDLWPGIDMAINHSSNATKTSIVGYASAACIGLAVIVSGWLNRDVLLDEQQPSLVAELTAQHQQQLDTMLIAYSQQQAVSSNWQQELKDLQTAAQVIRQALEQDPNNTALLSMLQDTYRTQLRLVERVHAPSWQKI